MATIMSAVRIARVEFRFAIRVAIWFSFSLS